MSNRSLQFLVVVLAAALVITAAWGFSNSHTRHVQAGGGQATLNQLLANLYQKNMSFAIEVNAPVDNQTTFQVTSNAAYGTYTFTSNGADHLCITGFGANSPTHCIPFSNIAHITFIGSPW